MISNFLRYVFILVLISITHPIVGASAYAGDCAFSFAIEKIKQQEDLSPSVSDGLVRSLSLSPVQTAINQQLSGNGTSSTKIAGVNVCVSGCPSSQVTSPDDVFVLTSPGAVNIVFNPSVSPSVEPTKSETPSAKPVAQFEPTALTSAKEKPSDRSKNPIVAQDVAKSELDSSNRLKLPNAKRRTRSEILKRTLIDYGTRIGINLSKSVDGIKNAKDLLDILMKRFPGTGREEKLANLSAFFGIKLEKRSYIPGSDVAIAPLIHALDSVPDYDFLEAEQSRWPSRLEEISSLEMRMSEVMGVPVTFFDHSEMGYELAIIARIYRMVQQFEDKSYVLRRSREILEQHARTNISERSYCYALSGEMLLDRIQTTTGFSGENGAHYTHYSSIQLAAIMQAIEEGLSKQRFKNSGRADPVRPAVETSSPQVLDMAQVIANKAKHIIDAMVKLVHNDPTLSLHQVNHVDKWLNTQLQEGSQLSVLALRRLPERMQDIASSEVNEAIARFLTKIPRCQSEEELDEVIRLFNKRRRGYRENVGKTLSVMLSRLNDKFKTNVSGISQSDFTSLSDDKLPILARDKILDLLNSRSQKGGKEQQITEADLIAFFGSNVFNPNFFLSHRSYARIDVGLSYLLKWSVNDLSSLFLAGRLRALDELAKEIMPELYEKIGLKQDIAEFMGFHERTQVSDLHLLTRMYRFFFELDKHSRAHELGLEFGRYLTEQKVFQVTLRNLVARVIQSKDEKGAIRENADGSLKQASGYLSAEEFSAFLDWLLDKASRPD